MLARVSLACLLLLEAGSASATSLAGRIVVLRIPEHPELSGQLDTTEAGFARLQSQGLPKEDVESLRKVRSKIFREPWVAPRFREANVIIYQSDAAFAASPLREPWPCGCEGSTLILREGNWTALWEGRPCSSLSDQLDGNATYPPPYCPNNVLFVGASGALLMLTMTGLMLRWGYRLVQSRQPGADGESNSDD